MRCVVVGAGIIGTCTALRLAQQGAEVTLVETGLPGDGTTGTSFAWVNAGGKRPREYFELNVAGMRAHRRLAAEWRHAPWFVPTGNLTWEDTAGGQEHLVKQTEELRAWGYGVELLSPRQVIRDLEPDLLIERTVEAVAFYPDEGHVYPRLLLTYLLRAVRSLGVELRTFARVSDLQMHGNRVSEVVLETGDRIAADVVVCCCGRWTGEVLHHVGVDLPLVSPVVQDSPAVGLLALSSGICSELRRVVHAPGINLRPDGFSRLLLHSDELDRYITLSTPLFPPPQAAESLLERANKVVRNMESAHVESATLGIRPIAADGLTVAGWIPGVEGLYGIVTHSGVTLGPALAEMATREINGATEMLLASFRPDRFLIS